VQRRAMLAAAKKPGKATVAQMRAVRRVRRGQSIFEALAEQRGMANASGAARRALRRAASGYTVKGRRPVFKTTTTVIPAKYENIEVRDPYGNWQYNRWGGVTTRQVQIEPERRLTEMRQAGTALALKKLRRKSGGPGGRSSGGERVSHRAGTQQARKSGAKRMGGTRGGIPSKEKRKHKKHKPQAKGT